MPTAASILTKAVRDVERLAQLQDDSAAAKDLAASIIPPVDQMHSLPPMPLPELQRLVLQRLATTCSRVSQAAPRSLAASAAFRVLAVILEDTKQLRQDLTPASTVNGLFAVYSIPGDNTGAVLLTIRAQLLQSGLLASMADVLTAAAEDLQSQQPQQGHGAVRFWDSQVQHYAAVAVPQHQLLPHCTTLLDVWQEVCLFIEGPWARQVQGAVQQSQASRAASAPAAVQLAAAVMELVSRDIPQLLASDQKAVRQGLQVVQGRGSRSAFSVPVAALAALVLACARRALSVVSTIASYLLPTGPVGTRSAAVANTGSGAAAGMSSEACLPEFTQLLTLLTFILCQATLLQARTASRAASTESSGSSSNGGGSDSSTDAAAASSTQPGASASQADKPRAIRLRDLRAAHKALSRCDTALLELLGFSSEAAVWVAAVHVNVAATPQVALMAKALLVTLKAPTGAAVTVPTQQQAPTQQQLNQQLLLLVPAMLLRWSAQASGDSGAFQADTGWLSPGMLAAFSSGRVAGPCADIDSTVNTATDCVRQWQQNIGSHRPAGANSSTADSAAAADSSVWLQPHLPAKWLQQVFPDIHTICSTREVASEMALMQMRAACSSVLVKFQAQLIAWAAQAGNQSDGTQAGTEVGGSAQTGPDHQQQQGTEPGACSTGSSSSSSSSGSCFEPPQPLPAALAAFQGVALQTIASFDSFARSATTRRAATDSVAEAVSSITGLCFSASGAHRPGPLLALVQAAGPGSREQQALYSCLRSTVKLATACVAPGWRAWWEGLFIEAALAAVLLLASPAPEQTRQASAEAGGTGSSSSAAAASSSTQPPAPAATVYLPSLVLLGCAFQFWAQELQSVVEPTSQRRRLLKLASGSRKLECLVQRVLDWLAGSSVMQQLAAEGHGVQQLPGILQGLLATQTAAKRSLDGEGSVETACASLQAELEAVGAALTPLATPAFCNNPACQNVSGPTERSLVSGRSCLCSGCCVARYCSRACQRAQWAQHKSVCKALAAAAAAAAGPAPVAAGSMG